MWVKTGGGPCTSGCRRGDLLILLLVPTACSDADFPVAERFEDDRQELVDRRERIARIIGGGGLISLFRPKW